MNSKLIRQLAVRAAADVAQQVAYFNSDLGKTWEQEVGRVRDERFAELIVRECLEVCKSRVGNSDYNTGRMHCVSDLKEHFGVK